MYDAIFFGFTGVFFVGFFCELFGYPCELLWIFGLIFFWDFSLSNHRIAKSGPNELLLEQKGRRLHNGRIILTLLSWWPRQWAVTEPACHKCQTLWQFLPHKLTVPIVRATPTVDIIVVIASSSQTRCAPKVDIAMINIFVGAKSAIAKLWALLELVNRLRFLLVSLERGFADGQSVRVAMLSSASSSWWGRQMRTRMASCLPLSLLPTRFVLERGTLWKQQTPYSYESLEHIMMHRCCC